MKMAVVVLVLVGCLQVAGSAQAESPRADVSGLRLPARAFSPATASGPTVVLNHDADHGYFYWLHSTSYAKFHRVTGIGEDAQWHSSPGSSDMVELLYLGSIFRSATDAANAYADAITYPVSQYGAVRQACPHGLPHRCARLQIANSSPPVSTQWHDAFAVGPCLVETMADRPTVMSTTAGVTQQTLKTLAAIDRAALSAAQKTCLPSGPFGFTLTKVAALDAQGHARSSFKAAQPFTVSLSWQVQHLTGTASAAIVIHYQVANGTHWRTVATAREQVVAVNGRNPYQKQIELHTPGRYRIVATVTIKSLSRHGSTIVTITR